MFGSLYQSISRGPRYTQVYAYETFFPDKRCLVEGFQLGVACLPGKCKSLGLVCRWRQRLEMLVDR